MPENTLPNTASPSQAGSQSQANSATTPQEALSKYTPSISEENLSKINQAAKEKAVMESAAKMGMNFIDIAVTPINPDLLKIIPVDIATANFIIPFYRLGKKLRVTVAHPTNSGTMSVIRDLKEKGYLININLSSEEGIIEALKIYQTDVYRPVKKIDTSLDEEKIKAYEAELVELKLMGEKLKGKTAEEAVYMICIGGVKAGASDIHLEAEEKFVRVRFRIDGILHEVYRIDSETFANISSQIKYQAKMRVNVNNVPQDGRFYFVVNQRKIDVRASTLPTEYGESHVFRLLDSSRKILTFDQLGFEGMYLERMNRLIDLNHGMVLVTGPTGSGKTTTLYTLLAKYNTPESKIITLEDPIEYHLEGIAQSQIDEKHGYSFSSGLRSILRQDPEIIMLGEIRDLETAQTAAQAALTGHVLLSTLHTNSAIETLPRLINIGLPSFMIAPSLHTIIAQRLARRVCTNCSVKKPITQSQKEEIEKVLAHIAIARPTEKYQVPTELATVVGCDLCSHTGYRGQITLAEMLEITFEIKDLILNSASTTKIIESARRQGMITIHEDGILKVIAGHTTLEEVNRATSAA